MFVIIPLAVLSAIFYRAGGLGKETKSWIPMWMRRSWVRDWLCPICVLLCFPFKNLLTWNAFFAYGLTGASLTTYWDSLFNDVDTFWFAGFISGVALLPMVVFYPLWAILARAVLLGIAWGLWCHFLSNDHAEEYGRGAFLVLTMAVLM